MRFEKYKLKDLVTIFNQKRIPLTGKERSQMEKKYPYYGAQGIIDYVDDYIFDGKYILVAEDGENLRSRKTSIATRASGKFWVNNHAHIIKNNDKSDFNFLYYYLFDLDVSEYLTGSVQPKLNKRNFENITINAPSLKKQQKIGYFLRILDKKVFKNNSIISNLEELAQTLFKRWFVDFEFPNEKGKPYKSSGGAMVVSELGMIPEGWEVNSLSKIASFQNGLAMQKFRPKEDEDSLPVLKIKELRQGFTDPNSDLCSINIKDSVKVYDGDVIFSWSATLLVKLWVGGDAGLNQHLFKVTSIDHSKWFYYLWTKHYLDIFNAIAKDKATTMGHIKRSHLDESKVIIPTQKYYDYFDSVFNKIIDQKVNLLKENKSLAELRDTLLPKLLSGEIELPDDKEVTDDV
uniref:restriction endonuclease subunit S n=1 Tax=Nosocomiicoccus ampullae TaxID=489910 RepID=UPI00083787E9|nr:restriction endonuclease subunit S [Nosocomiicoccus ampullae]